MGFNPYNGVSRGVGGTRTPIAVYEKVLVGLELSQWCFEGCWRGLELEICKLKEFPWVPPVLWDSHWNGNVLAPLVRNGNSALLENLVMLNNFAMQRRRQSTGTRGGMGSFGGAHGERVEREPITGVWGRSPQRGPGAEPLVRRSGAKPP